MKTMRCFLAIIFATIMSILAGSPEDVLKPALDVITPDGLLAHVKVLASDEFEGRKPGTAGEEKTVASSTGLARGEGC